jgi:hypothetical protein
MRRPAGSPACPAFLQYAPGEEIHDHPIPASTALKHCGELVRHNPNLVEEDNPQWMPAVFDQQPYASFQRTQQCAIPWRLVWP